MTLVGVVALVSLIVFFIVGGPFGFINDVSNAALAGTLAANWLRSGERPTPSLRVTKDLALIGVAAAVVGSTLIIFDTTGYFLAALVSASGFALVGTG